LLSFLSSRSVAAEESALAEVRRVIFEIDEEGLRSTRGEAAMISPPA